MPHYIPLFQLRRRMDLTQRNISPSCFQSQRVRYYCLGLTKADIEYDQVCRQKSQIQRRMTLQDGDLLQGLIFLGGCGEFDGYQSFAKIQYQYQQKMPCNFTARHFHLTIIAFHNLVRSTLLLLS